MLRNALPYALALVFVAATLALLANAHIEIFACQRDDFIYGAGRGGYGMQNRESAQCSLMYFTDESYRRYNPKLLPAGKVVLGLVGFVIPSALGYALGRRLTRRRARAESTD